MNAQTKRIPKLKKLSIRHAIHIQMKRLRIAQETRNKELANQIEDWLHKHAHKRNTGQFIFIEE